MEWFALLWIAGWSYPAYRLWRAFDELIDSLDRPIPDQIESEDDLRMLIRAMRL